MDTSRVWMPLPSGSNVPNEAWPHNSPPVIYLSLNVSSAFPGLPGYLPNFLPQAITVPVIIPPGSLTPMHSSPNHRLHHHDENIYRGATLQNNHFLNSLSNSLPNSLPNFLPGVTSQSQSNVPVPSSSNSVTANTLEANGGPFSNITIPQTMSVSAGGSREPPLSDAYEPSPLQVPLPVQSTWTTAMTDLSEPDTSNVQPDNFGLFPPIAPFNHAMSPVLSASAQASSTSMTEAHSHRLQRASHACDICKLKKIRCDNESPCHACQASAVQCTRSQRHHGSVSRATVKASSRGVVKKRTLGRGGD